MSEPTRQINDFMIAEGGGSQQRDDSGPLDGSLLVALDPKALVPMVKEHSRRS